MSGDSQCRNSHITCRCMVRKEIRCLVHVRIFLAARGSFRNLRDQQIKNICSKKRSLHLSACTQNTSAMFRNTVTQSKILLHKAKEHNFLKYLQALTCLQTHFPQGSAHKSLLSAAYCQGEVVPTQSFKGMHCDTLQRNAAERFPALCSTHICQGCPSKVTQALLAALGCQKAPQRKQQGPRGPLSFHRASLLHFRAIQPQSEEQLLFLELS